MIFDRYRFDQQLAMELGEKLLFAVIALVVTWLAARAAKWAFAKLVDTVDFFKRGTGNGTSLGESLGKIVSLLIWLFGLLIVLNILELGGVAGPINSLLENVVDFLPNLLWAGLIFFIGMMVARIVRDLVVTTLQAVDFDKWANRGGVDNVTGNTAISKTIGTIAYVLIAIPVAIAALEQLQIQSISDPASDMLRMIFAAIPNIIAAAILLGIGYLISKFVVQIAKEVLPGLGVDRALAESGLVADGTTASGIIARIAQVAIILFFAIAATRLLGFPELTAILDTVLETGSKVILGAVVIAVGFLIANLLARVIAGDAGNSTAATIVRWATIVLFVFMGLEFTELGGGIPQDVVTIIVAGIAVAGALAFGLGGRDWAARKLDQMDSDLGGGSASAPKPKRRKAAAPTSDDPLPPGA
ncbi:mechanosensitive ion channel [Qipengyuania gelatinilytica]|uniref:Small-conductance mechanosensitive channel n=1 Tax=Qipengyuania gelatinilytica TaxID=2867231 RepID=A0ABX8ZZN0_9SPHN|nr:mechanosensitive ion channel [Qipengyuania gelatinilytica]QZD94478.1 mechanosensitive ion channel [Qipengyuania gelatinilytica]